MALIAENPLDGELKQALKDMSARKTLTKAATARSKAAKALSATFLKTKTKPSCSNSKTASSKRRTGLKP